MNTLFKTYTFLLCLILLTSCSTTYPIYASINNSDEEFVGTATSRLSGDSNFTVMNADGVQCQGTYVAEIILHKGQASTASGNINCSDGRKGSWTASGTGFGGQGIGKLNGQKFKIFFGDSVRVITH